MSPSSATEARLLLERLGAPARLLRHVELVGEAADILIAKLEALGATVDGNFIRVGVVLHDAGKVLFPDELERAGAEHEPAGEQLLLAHGASPEVARVCRSHAQWEQMTASLEELLIALADKLWKGVRKSELEEQIISYVAKALGQSRWDVFVTLDNVFEEIASGGDERLSRSRVA